MKPSVLIVDDEKNIRRTLGMILKAEGYAVRDAGTGAEATALLDDAPADLVLLDVNLPGASGLEILKDLKRRSPELPVVMISGEATVATAVEATRAGAFDFLEKPLAKDRVLIAVRNALRAGRLDARVARLEAVEAQRRAMVGESEALEAVRRLIDRAAPRATTVLVTGESGTGKELVARAVHDGSPRRDGPFVKVNCAAIPEELIETELFGCVKGAYTGADRNRDGKFLLADGGTIFLDEIGDMSLKVQAKVLRALQEGEIQRVGDATLQRVDVRVVAATNKDLAAEVRAGRFREDLFYRLNVVPVTVPPLRERSEDIPLLAGHILGLYAAENGLPERALAPDALELLRARRWPGNIRELRNVLERLAILADGDVIAAADVRAFVPDEAPATGAATADAFDPEAIERAGGLAALRRDWERALIARCLERSGGNVAQAARWLGLERTNLHKKMQSLDLTAGPSRSGKGSEEETPS